MFFAGGPRVTPTPTLLSVCRRARQGGGRRKETLPREGGERRYSGVSTPPSPLEGEGWGGGYRRRARALQNQWQPGGDENDAVRRRGDRLIELSGTVAEVARQGIVRHDAEPDLIGDEDERSVERRYRGNEPGCLRHDIAAGKQQVRQPQRQAIDQNRAGGPRRRAETHHEIRRL